MKIQLLLFGAVRAAAGGGRLEVDPEDGATVADLRAWLAARNAAAEKLGDRLAVSINTELAQHADVLEEGDEVAFLPPVAGGDGSVRRCTISDTPLDEAEVCARVEGPDAGGVVSFVGRVRNRARGHAIEHLEYEAYPTMAEKEMEKIADAAAERSSRPPPIAPRPSKPVASRSTRSRRRSRSGSARWRRMAPTGSTIMREAGMAVGDDGSREGVVAVGGRHG